MLYCTKVFNNIFNVNHHHHNHNTNHYTVQDTKYTTNASYLSYNHPAHRSHASISTLERFGTGEYVPKA